MSVQKGNIFLATFLIVFVVLFILGFGYFYLQKTNQKSTPAIRQTIDIPQIPQITVSPTAVVSNLCKGENFYEEQALSLKYQIQSNFVSVSGCLSSHPGTPCQEKTLNLTPAQAFYLSSGKEQSVKVTLQKIENNRAYFLFSYSAAPPAPGPSYACEFIKE